MRERTISLLGGLKLLGLSVVVGAASVFILGSSLATPVAAALIGLLLLGSVFGVAILRKSDPVPEQTEISDPIFVNETWILKR